MACMIVPDSHEEKIEGPSHPRILEHLGGRVVVDMLSCMHTSTHAHTHIIRQRTAQKSVNPLHPLHLRTLFGNALLRRAHLVTRVRKLAVHMRAS